MSESKGQAAQDIKAITELKAQYWHCVDNKLWDALGNCFTEDAVADYPNGRFEGRPAAVGMMEQTLGHGPVRHEGHNLNIAITGDATAEGTWQADVSMTDPRAGTEMHMKVSYEDLYIKEKGEWKIKNTKMRIMSAG